MRMMKTTKLNETRYNQRLLIDIDHRDDDDDDDDGHDQRIKQQKQQ